jgi:hypothetical protein
VFYDLTPGSSFGVPIGKYSDFNSIIMSLDAFEVKKFHRQFLVCGDDLGYLHLFQFHHDWHLCNEDLPCHQEVHANFRLAEIATKKKNIVDKVENLNKKFQEENSDKKVWLWREMVDFCNLIIHS